MLNLEDGCSTSYLCIWAPGHTLHYDGLVLLFDLKPIILLVRMDLYGDKSHCIVMTINISRGVERYYVGFICASKKKIQQVTARNRTCNFQDSNCDLAVRSHAERAAAFVQTCEQATYPLV